MVGAMHGEDERGRGPSEYSIGDLSREFGVTTRTIRFYEDEGLLTPQRRGQARVYRARDRVRLRLILRGKRLGFSLAEIREILGMYESEPGEAGQLRHLIERIGERRAALRRQRADIDQTLADMAAIEARCAARLAALAPGRKRRAS
jgi:DNA-binding transcriptional MerR regulator